MDKKKRKDKRKNFLILYHRANIGTNFTRVINTYKSC